MIGALFYLQFHSTWNRLLTRVKRLKKPKYLIGAVAGGVYCYFYFFRFLFSGRRSASLSGITIAPVTMSMVNPVAASVRRHWNWSVRWSWLSS